MKKLALLLILMLAAAGMIFAETTGRGYRSEMFTQDARIMAMGGYTAVADDVNALFYNPAGLAYLDSSDFMLGGTMYFDFKGAILDETDDLYYRSEDADEGDVGEFAFHGMSVVSRAAFADNGWGIAAISDIGIVPDVTGYIEREEEDDGYDLEVKYDLFHNAGLMGGLGFNVGPLAVGANLRLYKSLTMQTEKITHDQDLDYGDLFDETMDELFDFANAEERMEVGVGAMATLGKLTAGAYIDSFLDLMDYDDHIFDQALKTANVGLSFTPLQSRFDLQSTSPINLIIAGDFYNIGDNENRSLSVGSELGLHLGRAVTLDLRGGYRQRMPGEFEDITFNTDDGEVFFGLGGKLLAFDMNMAVSLPATMLEADDEEFGSHGDPRFSLSAGIRL